MLSLARPHRVRPLPVTSGPRASVWLMESSAAPLAISVSTTPRRVIDDPAELDEEQLRELLRSSSNRAMVLGVATGALAVLLTAVLAPLTWVGAFAAVPAYVIGYTLSTTVARRNAAAQLGVTPRCLRAVERAVERAQLRRDVRTMRAREWIKTDIEVAARLTREELQKRSR